MVHGREIVVLFVLLGWSSMILEEKKKIIATFASGVFYIFVECNVIVQHIVDTQHNTWEVPIIDVFI